MESGDGYSPIDPGDLAWRPLIQIEVPNADILERTGSELLGARLWRLPPKSAGTPHRHIKAPGTVFRVRGRRPYSRQRYALPQ